MVTSSSLGLFGASLLCSQTLPMKQEQVLAGTNLVTIKLAKQHYEYRTTVFQPEITCPEVNAFTASYDKLYSSPQTLMIDIGI